MTVSKLEAQTRLDETKKVYSRAVGRAFVVPADVMEKRVMPVMPWSEPKPSSGTRDDPLTNWRSCGRSHQNVLNTGDDGTHLGSLLECE